MTADGVRLPDPPRYVTEAAVELLPADQHLTPAWHALRRGCVSASEVAAVVGVSPYVDPFDLWWAKRTGQDSQPENRAMGRGRRREAAILEDFADGHPELHVLRVGLCASLARPWQVCSPDALAYERTLQVSYDPAGVPLEPLAVVEAKTDGGSPEWGDDGSDQVPLHYRCQAMWLMDTLGLAVCWFPVWHGFGYREYLVEYDPALAAELRDAARDFLDSVEAGEQPEPGGHPASRRRLKALHPLVEDREVEVPAYLARQYDAAKRLRQTAQEREDQAANRILARMGSARIATVDGAKAFSRSVSDIKKRTQVVSAHTQHRLYRSRARTEKK